MLRTNYIQMGREKEREMCVVALPMYKIYL